MGVHGKAITYCILDIRVSITYGRKEGGRDRQTEGIVLVMTQGKTETGKSFFT